MCGIIGYTGTKQCVPILIEGLTALEYRGYDSAGVAFEQNGEITSVKAKGRLSALEEKLDALGKLSASCGIGHTRWATHGEPSDINSHPHYTENLALVHNGIIENYSEIEEMLSLYGYTFDSETDTERAAKLIDLLYLQHKDPLAAIIKAKRQLRGSFAFGIIFSDYPDAIYAVRKDSPLIVAKNADGSFIASDVPAILAHTSEYYRPEENIIAEISKSGVKFFDDAKNQVEQPIETVDWNVEQAQRGGFAHFMIKEIYEEPEALRKTVEPRIREGLPYFSTEALDGDSLSSVGSIHIVACGTAMHAGLFGKAIIEKLARVPVNVEIASEFRYRDPILRKNDLVILLSQSGETADTLAALRHAKKNGISTLAIVNVIGSSVAREADNTLYTWAGPEIAVASTKAYSVQCALLYLLAVKLGSINKTLSVDMAKLHCSSLLSTLPSLIEETLKLDGDISKIALELTDTEHAFYIGRDIDKDICIEASLKLKEISYIHSEAYPAGELKHGTISLITEGTPVIALVTAKKVCEKTISGIREVKARGAKVILVVSKELDGQFDIPFDRKLVLPNTDAELLLPFSATTVMQLLAYHVSFLLGHDVDKPRNLAKSVTVE